jgi:hypothetical protein
MVLLKCWCSGKLGLMREQVEEFLESFCNTTLPPPGLTREANNEPLIEIDLAPSLGAGRAAIRTALALLSYVVEALRAAKHTRQRDEREYY